MSVLGYNFDHYYSLARQLLIPLILELDFFQQLVVLSLQVHHVPVVLRSLLPLALKALKVLTVRVQLLGQLLK